MLAGDAAVEAERRLQPGGGGLAFGELLAQRLQLLQELILRRRWRLRRDRLAERGDEIARHVERLGDRLALVGRPGREAGDPELGAGSAAAVGRGRVDAIDAFRARHEAGAVGAVGAVRRSQRLRGRRRAGGAAREWPQPGHDQRDRPPGVGGDRLAVDLDGAACRHRPGLGGDRERRLLRLLALSRCRRRRQRSGDECGQKEGPHQRRLSSTRRLRARPSAVSLRSFGERAPWPSVASRAAAMP